MIQNRTNAGLARAKAQVKVLGRPQVDVGIEPGILVVLASGRG